jgi:hypothetical protein
VHGAVLVPRQRRVPFAISLDVENKVTFYIRYVRQIADGLVKKL